LRRDDPHIVSLIIDLARQRGFVSLGLFDREGKLQLTWAAEKQTPFASPEQAGIAKVLAGGKPYVSDLQVTGITPLFYLSVPVTVEGQAEFVLTGGVPSRQLQGLFAEAGLRDEWRAGIVDRTGVIMARSRESVTYVGHAAQQPMVDAARGNQSSGLFDVVTRDGLEVKNAFQRSLLTSWTVGVAVPASVVNSALWSATFILTAVGFVLTLLSLGLGILVARRITRDVNHLGHAVVAYASGDVVPLPTATLAELRDVLRVVEAAAAVDGNRGILRAPDRA
jgi:hypothetical protein